MSGPTGTPVFFDPLRRRWKWARRISLVLMVALTGVLSALVVGILTVPTLPKINLVLPNPTLPGALIAHPGQGGSTPNPAQQYQNLVATLSIYRGSPTATTAALVTVMPINPTALVLTEPAPPPTPVPPQPPAPAPTPLPPTAVPQPSATSRRPASAPTPKHTPNARPTATPRPAAFEPMPGSISLPGIHLASFNRGSAPTSAASPTAAPSAGGLVIGFYVNWDDNSAASLRQNISQLDRLIPEWLHLADGTGTIVDDDLTRENQALNFIRQSRPELAILPLVNNINPQTHQWDGASLATVLADPAARSKAVQSLLGYVQGNQLAGICIDFENVPPASQADLNSFM
ncbi:MAG TPA: hypothetical protein VF813_07680, partial [Anaerolineaceae bacterium]